MKETKKTQKLDMESLNQAMKALIEDLRVFFRAIFKVEFTPQELKKRLDYLIDLEKEHQSLVEKKKEIDEKFKDELTKTGLTEAQKKLVKKNKVKMQTFFDRVMELLYQCMMDEDKNIISIHLEKGITEKESKEQIQYREIAYTGKMLVTFLVDTGVPKEN